MGCKLSKKNGFCNILKKHKDRKADGVADISETDVVAHTSQGASECTESQSPTGTRKDIEQAAVEAQSIRYDRVPAAPCSQETTEDTAKTLSVLQTVQGCEAQTTAQSTGKASQDKGAQPVAEIEQEPGEAEPNTKVTQGRQPVAQTPKDNESQPAAEIPEEGTEMSKTLWDVEIKQDPEAQPIKQDRQLASCITEDWPALEAMQEAGKMETSVQTTAEIVEHMQETPQYTDETQPTLQTAQEQRFQPMSETEQQTAENWPVAQILEGAQAAAGDALHTSEAKPTSQSVQEIPRHLPEAQSALQRLQGIENQTSTQATEDTVETQPASESGLLLAIESKQEAGETLSAGEKTEESQAWPDADRAQESGARSVTQDREPAALSLQGTVASLSATCTTEGTKGAEPALQTAQEGQAQTTACIAGESWTVQGAAEAYPAAETKETGPQLVVQGPFETQPTIETPQGTNKNMQIMEDISTGLVEPKAPQESPLEPVTIPIKLTIEKTQPAAQVTPEMETLHPELKKNQGQENDLDSQSPSPLTGYKERWGNSAIPEEEDQVPELEATEIAKPEQQQLNVEQLAPPRELPVSHVPESQAEKCQLLDSSVLKASKSEREEEAETPIPSETQGSEGERALESDARANSEEPQETEITDSMSEPYSLCRRTCCT